MRQRMATLALVAGLILGVGTSLVPDARAAGLLIADGGLGGRLEIEEHTVDVTINNGVAVTTVRQIFRNLENRQVEALYTFPVPKGASVANFSMWIKGQEMVGEVVEKERAREIYDSYKQVRRDPGLLEQTDFKTFEMRIFPIGPGAEQRVEISYYQELDFDNDWATYVYPLATTTRQAIDTRAQGRFGLTLEIASEVPIAELESPSHGDDFALAQHTPRHARASLETAGGDLGRDVVVAYRLRRPVTGIDLIGSREPDEDGYFLLTLTPGEELGRADDFGMDYVFVLDISGSMREGAKLSLSRGSLDSFVRALGENDRFDVVAFNVAANELFGELRPADASAKAGASRFIHNQQAKGGTFLEPALRAAYRYHDPDRALNVVILSDGMSAPRERQTLVQLIGERPAGTRVFAIGVGNDIDRPLLEQLAEDAGGLAAFVSRGDDFDRQAAAFRRKLLRPVATDIEIEIDGGQVYDVEPPRLPNLFHGAPVRMYGRYRDAGKFALTVRGNLGGEVFERVMSIELPPAGTENPEIERMWAWHRVDRLLKDADRAGRRPNVLDEVVRLGEGYSIVTEYTSFLVLENDAEYRRWKIERRNATRIERDRRSQQRVRDELAGLRRASEIGPLAGAAEPEAQPPRTTTTARRGAPPVSTGRDLPLRPPGSSGGGGGALDPLTVGLVAALGGLGWAARRRRQGRDG